MTLTIKDRILETSITSGTGDITLLGAVIGYKTFEEIGDSNTCPYLIVEVDEFGVPTGSWETGIGTYTSASRTLARTTVTWTNAGSTSPISLGSGVKRVACTINAAFILNALLPCLITTKSSNTTVQSSQTGSLFVATSAVTFSLPTISDGLIYRFLQSSNSNLTILGSANILHKGNASANQVLFSTTGEKIGSQVMVEARNIDGTLKWVVSNIGGTTATVS